MQDQAFLGPGVRARRARRGRRRRPLRRHPVAARRPAADLRRRSACRPDQVRLTLAGVGGAFGGREDLSMHVHACLLALHTGKPVKMVYNREESFFGHVHRHPAKHALRARRDPRRQARLRQGDDRPGRRRVRVDARRPSSATPARWALGPYVVPNVHIDCYGAYTNNPPAARCAASARCRRRSRYEAQMDKLADALGMDPVEFRGRNAMEQGSAGADRPDHRRPAPVAELLRRGQRDAAAAAGPSSGRRGVGPAAPARRRVQHHPRRGRPPRRRLRRRHTRTSASPRASTTTRPPGSGWRSSAGEPRRDRAHRGGRGRPGPGHRRAADRPHRARRRAGRRSTRRTPRSGRPARRRRRGRPTSPAARSRPPARPSAGLVLAASSAVPARATVAELLLEGGKVVTDAARSLATLADVLGSETRSRRRSSGGTGRPSRSTRRPARATPTCSTPSPRTARSSTSTPSSAWSRSSSWPAPRTSARRSTRWPSSARSRAAPPRASGWR